MILVDTSIWIDHLRSGDPVLVALLEAGRVRSHPFIVGELALGALRSRESVLGMLRRLPRAAVAGDSEVLRFIDDCGLAGSGVGYVDAHLLAAARLNTDTLWTRDVPMRRAAERLGLTFAPR